ncbi:MAG TPA: diphosphate--fructose-6-phosphate 1-phosphotransferase [Thermoanaerobaculia bacterium]|nr:diphosphate--fructose-6-phosphate 1-phosphotransferase [Thermoanaerobaculia bacterium]
MAGEKLGILVGGGPAPGINSVISAATIRAALDGVDAIGIRDGFERIMRGDAGHVMPLTIDDVSRIHFRGGSILGTSRANPSRDPARLEATVDTLGRLGISRLITIGGDDTAFTAMKLEEKAGGRLRVVHVPKTIDNDLDLPSHVDTFGYQTARHHGVEIVENLMVDAKTTARWYFVVAMGRKAGHLALGMGKAAGATLTLIPEEFTAGPPRFSEVVDTLAGAVIKRLAKGRRDGVAVIAEGLVLSLAPGELAELKDVERDAHGNVRIAEVDFGDIVKRAVSARLNELGLSATIVAKDVGYELRCADPIPFDLEYTRDLGYAAASFLLDGGNAAMVSMQDGRFVPIPFSQLLDPATGRARVRMVDVRSARYAIARRYMVRLRREDFENPEELARLAAAAHLSPADFRARFEPLLAHEPAPAAA